MSRKGAPWLRLEAATYSDARVRKGRCGAVWPWVLTILKQCGGTATDLDLDADLAAMDLSITEEQAREQLEGAKRVGLLVRAGDEWTTPSWTDYQPDPRSRWDKREPSQAVPGTDRDKAGQKGTPRDAPSGPKVSRSDPTDGTGRDGTGRDTPLPPTGGAVEEPVDEKGRPLHHPERVAEVTAAAFAATPDESRRVADAGHRLMAALGLSMADTVRRSSPASRVLSIISSEPVEVVEELARATEQQAGGIRAPVAWVDNALPGARVEAERQAALDRHIEWRRSISEQANAAARAEHDRGLRMLADPEQMARTSAMFRQALAEMDAEAAQ